MCIFSCCTSTTDTPLSPVAVLSSQTHVWSSRLISHFFVSVSSWCVCNLLPLGVLSLLPFTPSLPLSLHPCFPPTSSPATKEEYLVYNYSNPYCLLLLLPSYPSLPSHPIASPPTPWYTPQINMDLIRERGDAEHIACSAGKEGCLSLRSRSLSFSISIAYTFFSDSTETAKPQQRLLPVWLFFLAFSFSLLVRIYKDGKRPCPPPPSSFKEYGSSLFLFFSTKQFFIICTACVNSAKKQWTGVQKKKILSCVHSYVHLLPLQHTDNRQQRSEAGVESDL